MKTLLIFGAKGTLGQALVSLFGASPEYNVVGLDRQECDITDEAAVKAIVAAHNPDMIINAAAYNAVDDIETDDDVYETAKAVNGHAPGILARAAQVHNSVFVHYSTDYVFDGTKEDGYTEDAAPHPISRYAETKREGEHEVQKGEGKHYIIRISRLFGKPGSGEGSKKSFVDKMLELAQSRDTLDVVSDQVSCPSYAPDVALFTKLLLEGDFAPGIYHGANVGGCSWYEWAAEVFRLADKQITLNKVPASHFPRPAKAPMHSVLINTKGPQQRSWQDALKDYLS